MSSSNLSGGVALITGASRGIGRAIAGSLAERGVSLMLVGRNEERLAEAAAELEAATELNKAELPETVEIATCAADLAGSEAPSSIVRAVEERFGRLDILINNAGIAEGASVDETTPDLWERHMALNARAPFFLCREALTLLRASHRARIVNIGSVVSHKGYEKQGAYAASKHALYGLTKVLARELHSDAIRVHFVAPGGVATDLVSGIRPDLDPDTLIQPEEVARAVCFMLEQGASAATDELSLRREGSQPWK